MEYLWVFRRVGFFRALMVQASPDALWRTT